MPLDLAKSKSRDRIGTSAELAAAIGDSEEFIHDVVARKADHYTSFPKKKPNGEIRLIEPPKIQLRLLQRRILRLLYLRIRVPGFLHGGLPNRSTLTHAAQHVGQRMVGTFDLRKFFPTTSPAHVLPVLLEAGFDDEAVALLLELVTLNGGLPQGSPTSSLLANLAFICADVRIRAACWRRGYRYSRFVDDIAISGDGDISQLKGLVKNVVKETGFQLADDKTKFRRQGTRQVVTGLVVNDKLRPTKEFIQQLSDDLHFCQEHGPEDLADELGISATKLKAQLKGRICHLGQFDARRADHFGRLVRYAIKWSALTRVA